MSTGAMQPLRVVMFGDSAAASRPGVVAYADLLARAFHSAGLRCEVFNAGLDGHTTDHAIARLEALVQALSPHLVVIQYGTDDAAIGNGPPPAGPVVAVEKYQQNLTRMVQSLRGRGIHVVLITPTSARPYAQAMRTVAQAQSVPLVDLFAAAADEPLSDGNHANSAGHRAIAALLLDQAVKPWLAQVLGQKNVPPGLSLPQQVHAEPGEICLEAPPAEGNPRNSEGAFVQLADGRLLLAYTRYCGTSGGDNAPADIAACFSRDAGRTWSPPEILIKNEGQWNVMSVSLLRLADGRIALLHLLKNEGFDSRPRIRFSSDEAKTWSAPVDIIPEPGYYVVNNDRLVQLHSGRLIVPASRHQHVLAGDPPKGTYLPGILSFWLSDDGGATWRQSAGGVYVSPVTGSKSGLQEPGLIELADGQLFAWARTSDGCQHGLYSRDGGETWTPPAATGFISPCSPLSIRRIPSTGHLLAIWNDHSGRFAMPPDKGRQPFVAAISRDEGKTWENHRQVESHLTRGYHYTAIDFPDDHQTVLLSYCAGPRKNQLGTLRVRKFPVEWLYR